MGNIMKRALIAAAVFAALSAAGAEEYFMGEGGRGLSVSVEKPQVQNVGDYVSWLPDYASNVISDGIKMYFSIAVVERHYEATLSSALAHEKGAEYADDGVEVMSEGVWFIIWDGLI